MVDQTPALKAVIDELQKRQGTLPGMRTPQVIRDKIIGGRERPDKGWSQHSYRNASDIMIYGATKQKPIVDELKRMKSQGFPVGVILDANYNADHKDHIHVEGSPAVKGDPKDPSTWTINGGSGSNPGPGTGPGETPINDTGAELDDLNWWDYIINPSKVGEAAGNAIEAVLLRVVFGIVAIIAAVVTVLVIVNAFKGEIAGAAVDTVIGKVTG